MWILLGMIIIGVVIMEWPMKPDRKEKGDKEDGGDGKDGDA